MSEGRWENTELGLCYVHGNEICIQLVVYLVRILNKTRGTVVVSSVFSAVFVAAYFFLVMPLQKASWRYLWIEGVIQVLQLKRRS